MRVMRTVVPLLLVAAACGGDPDPLDAIPEECNPLGGTGCVTPWPSSAYLRDDASSPTGVRVDLPFGAMPVNDKDVELDVAQFNRRTGFSPASQLFAVFPEGVDDSNLVFHDEIERSLEDSSPTVIVDMETGERVAHFAELDLNAIAAGKPEQQALYLRPAARLAFGHRYAVGIRRSLSGLDGPLATPPGFAAILEGRETSHPRLEAMRASTLAAIGALGEAGVPEDDLLLAWELVAADQETLLEDPRRALEASMAAMGADAAAVDYQVVVDDSPQPFPEDPEIVRRIILRFSPPTIAGDEGLFRDGDGAPIVQGAEETEASIIVPACATAATPAGIIIYGHGFFGDINEPQNRILRRVARDLCMVVVGGTWRGMAEPDVGVAAQALNDANNTFVFAERLLQGISDFIALEQLARTRLATDLLVDGTGASIVDPSRTYYYGVSQGSVLGTVFFAWDPNLTRGAFHVGGAAWSLLFERSTYWVTFGLILKGAYPEPVDQVIMQQILQTALDVVEPANVEGLAPDKQRLLQMSVGDAKVTNLATLLQARTFGLPLLAPALEVPYGLTETDGPLDDGFVIFTEEPSPLPPETNITNDEGNEAHDQLRKRDAVIEQIGIYFDTGQIVNTCDGVCNCAQGACGELDPP